MQLMSTSWSPLHELVPETPLRHGHAISIDMAYSATLANMRGLLTKDEYERLLWLFSKAGLSMDHHQFDEAVLEKATAAILRTRDGLLRAAVPNPIGSCVFLNDVSAEELNAALHKHKEVVKQFPRNGEGLDAYVDASDTGEGLKANGSVPINGSSQTNGHAKVIGSKGVKGSANGHINGVHGAKDLNGNGHVSTNGHADEVLTTNGEVASINEPNSHHSYHR